MCRPENKKVFSTLSTILGYLKDHLSSFSTFNHFILENYLWLLDFNTSHSHNHYSIPIVLKTSVLSDQ